MRTLMVYSRRYRGINSPFIMVLYKFTRVQRNGTTRSTCPKQYSWVGRLGVLKPLVTFTDEVCGRWRPSYLLLAVFAPVAKISNDLIGGYYF